MRKKRANTTKGGGEKRERLGRRRILIGRGACDEETGQRKWPLWEEKRRVSRFKG